MSYTASGDQESGLHKAITFLSKVIGGGAAILFTPDVYSATRAAVFSHLQQMWSADVARILTWIFGFLEGLAIYALLWMGLSMAILAAMTSWAAKRFGGQP